MHCPGREQAPAAASSSGEGSEWEDWAPADDKWRLLLKNDPFAKSAMGGDV